MDNNFEIQAQTLLKAQEVCYEFNEIRANWINVVFITDEFEKKANERQQYLKKVIEIAHDEKFVSELKRRLKTNCEQLEELAKSTEKSNLRIEYNDADENILPYLENTVLSGEMLRLLEEQDKLLEITKAPKAFHLVELENNPLQFFTLCYYKTKVVNQLDNTSLRIDIGDGPKYNSAKFEKLNLILEQKK